MSGESHHAGPHGRLPAAAGAPVAADLGPVLQRPVQLEGQVSLPARFCPARFCPGHTPKTTTTATGFRGGERGEPETRATDTQQLNATVSINVITPRTMCD